MSDGASQRQRARTFEQRENWKRAIEAYEAAIEADRRARKEVDLALYNRIGDLYRRIGDVNRAVHYYELAADGHLAAGFYNNAIALCNKILRNQPNRHSAYLKLGKIGAAKGFLSDARRHFLEYAERMQRAGQLDEAFAALIEFADLSPDPEVRLMIADQAIEHDHLPQAVEQLRLAWRYMKDEGRDADAREVRQRIIEMEPERDPEMHPPEAAASTAVDAEGVLELPEILPWGAAEPEPSPAVTEEPVETEPTDYGSVEVVADDVGQLDVESPEIDMAGVELDAASLDVDPLASDASLEFEPASLDQEPDFGVGLESPPGEDDIGTMPTTLEPEEVFEEPELGVVPEPSLDFLDEPNDFLAAPAAPVAPAPPSPAERVAELEARLQAEGRQPDLLFDLAEALLETGDSDKAMICLGEALELHERMGQYREAGRVLDELLRLNVNDVRAYQKRVELALRAADRPGLVEAYLSLADCLDRTDASNKARAVYARVLELDRQNGRAIAALEMFVDEPEAAPPAAAPAGAPASDFVDLGTIIREEAEAKSTRFRIAAADPQSEADVNFSEMLSQFKSKIAEAIEEEDAASHYDLGVAFKEMGLVDEAIAEFQIAARGLDFRLRAIEMLGACFVEKGDHRIALKVLGRALQVRDHKDEELVGIFYAMARSYEDLGETKNAVDWYERILSCDVNFKDVSRRVEALRQ
jgi:tetratricopeptide (TPR) repeat protein